MAKIFMNIRIYYS